MRYILPRSPRAICRPRARARAVILALSAWLAALAPGSPLHAQEGGEWLDAYRAPAGKLIDEAVSNRFAWNRLAELTDRFGHRLSGTPQLDAAIQWVVAEMKRDGLENVHTEPVMVPRWVRGRESAAIVQPATHQIAMLGLGGSVATPPEGLQAEVHVVHSFEQLDREGSRARGRIVLFNVPFTNYGDTVAFRGAGASRAARYGAVAMLIRSVGPPGLRLPHTGALQYAAGAPQIPAAAIATEDADRLQRMFDRGDRPVVRLHMEARFEADVESANVVGELRGWERPEEIVVVAGHLDSWDVGDGASDDGGGSVVTWEALRLMKKLGLRPRRTVRVVLFTNEENGGRGGLAYRDAHRQELPRHVLMIESDTGVFAPTGFGFTGTAEARRIVEAIATLLAPIGATAIGPVGGGADIEPSMAAANVPGMSLDVEGDYFMIHHTAADTVDKIDPREMARCAAAVAVMAYVVADRGLVQ
jgi:carboxypeptidase Q